MPYKEKPIEKLYYKIGDVAEEIGVATSAIRYWEKHFPDIEPKMRGKRRSIHPGDRIYTKDQLEMMRIIKTLRDMDVGLRGISEMMGIRYNKFFNHNLNQSNK